MSFWRDRQFRHFYVFLMGVLAALTVFAAVIWMMYGRLSKEMYLSHNRSVVSSLLEAGVERNVIARAFAADASSPEGEALVEMMGIGEDAETAFLPGIAGMQSKMAVFMTGFVMSLWLVQMAGAGFFFSDREKVYAEAEKMVRKFTEGDFSGNLSYLEEGRLHQLFGSVDHLAKALAAQGEMTGRAKAFLKDTISDISHQMKTPLAALEMYCEIILAEPENTETVIKFTKKASEALIRMEQLILALLKITRLDAGAVIFEKVIILPRYPKKQLEFFDAVLLHQKRFQGDLSLVGLASGYMEALDVVRRITEEVYQETKDADIKAFFEKEAFIRLD